MEIKEITQLVFQYGGTVIMAMLFVWVFIQDKTRNSALLEEIKEIVRTLKVSNENIARTLELLQNGCDNVEKKIDRNYEMILKKGDYKNGRT